MRASDLQGKQVVTETGERLGHVVEIHATAGEVTALTVGHRGWLQRFWSSRRGRRVDWKRVRKVTPRQIVVDG